MTSFRSRVSNEGKNISKSTSWKRDSHLDVTLLELRPGVRKSANFRRTDEGKVKRVEEKYDVLALVVRQADLGQVSVNGRIASELRGWLSYLTDHFFF